MRNFYDLDLTDWQDWCRTQGWPGYRAAQIQAWQARGLSDFSQMSDLSKRDRALLADHFYAGGLSLQQELISQQDDTRKYVFSLHDGNQIESVRMQYRYGVSVCISSQAGCRMGCIFCASTGAGFGRNLSHGEMLAQVAQIGARSAARVSHVVVMGIGEPFENYDNLLRFLYRVNDPAGLAIGMRHLTVSTCGLIPEMLKFSETKLPVTLTVSLHAPNQAVRERLMPIARQYPFDQLLRACRKVVATTGRRISFEYALFKGVNDRREMADELAEQLQGLNCHVNLIPANAVPDSKLAPSTAAAVSGFAERLSRLGIAVTIRRELGSDIEAACGQLRRSMSHA